ncbi:hypothetical protein CF168_01600 [Shewanella bicestrii]|uniref:Uncharacterized protein n=1 Tax=Shewanella bicestrii TaxID=2018305 RepID=A0A220UHD8_9GAMM|nr:MULTISPECIES: hypothetical protein [Shewanella]ASK67654.1 hypothetical protein CF168_01600 [Shewanella bicestrii]MDH0450412.1 hypothetical protein [Shewanella sp. GD04112]
MTRMILLLELGDWAGGHHGQSPYLVEFDSERLDSPFDVSEGWGHGLGGSSYSLARFVETEHYAQLKHHAPWATTIIKQGLPTLDIGAIAQGLLAQYSSHRPNIPANLARYF